MNFTRSQDPLHGITLEKILTDLVDHLGWDEFAKHVKLNCFTNDPSIKSSLKFLRKTPWARNKVEKLYLEIRPKGRTVRLVREKLN